jgi:hypothetical protein
MNSVLRVSSFLAWVASLLIYSSAVLAQSVVICYDLGYSVVFEFFA